MLPWCHIEFVRPNVPLVSTETGENLDFALHKVPQVSYFSELEIHGLKNADLKALHFDLDGHAANPRLVGIRRAHLANMLGRAPPISMKHCHNHLQNLVDIAVTAACNPDLVAILARGFSFFKMGTNFLRLHRGLQDFVREHCPPPSIDPVDALARAIADELQDYFTCNYKYFEDAQAEGHAAWSSDSDSPPSHAEPTATRRRKHILLKRAWDEYRRCFNGHIWRDEIVGIAKHHLLPGIVPPSRQAVVKAIAGVHFRSLPVSPQPKKWTKLGTSLDWHLLNVGCMNMLPRLLPRAFAKFSAPSDGGGGDEEAKPFEFLSGDFDYHKVESAMYRAYSAGVAAAPFLPSTIIMCIVMEPLRYITKWFLRRSSVARRTRAQLRSRRPPLCDLMSATSSVFIKVLQYLSFLLTGRAPRLALLWGRRYDSFSEWASSEPDQLQAAKP